MEIRSILQSVVENLKRHNQMPRRIDFSVVGNRYWCVVSDSESDKLSVINEDVYTGLSDSKEVALLKALSERAERYSFIEGYRAGLDSCQTERSDGFAAIPKIMNQDLARENALSEAIERFVWSTWWDDTSISFVNQRLLKTSSEVSKSEYLKFVFSELDLEYIDVITPSHSLNSHLVQILFGKIRSKGFISGGACGSAKDTGQVFLRGLDELYRHGFAFNRSLDKNINPISFYEKRLNYFASGEGNKLVESRLNAIGVNSIQVPMLEIDDVVEGRFHSYQIHRCYFKGQPPFVGGKLERLCL